MTPTVSLRAKKTTTKGWSLYIDIYTPGQKKRQSEFLRRYVSKNYTRGGRVLLEDKAEWDAANEQYQRRRNEIRNKGYNVQDINIKNRSFIGHFETVCKEKNNNSYRGALSQLKAFKEAKERHDITIGNLSPALLADLKEFILGRVKQNTARTYIKRYSIAFNLLPGSIENPFAEIDNIKMIKGTYDFLSEDDIEKLAKVNCPGVKDIDRLSFLFACYTGLRLGDIRQLTWDNIKPDRIEKFTEKSQYSKKAVIPRHDNLNAIIERLDPKTNLVFEGMTAGSHINRQLRAWLSCTDIELDRAFTFHMSRHSFISNLAQSGAAIQTVSRLATHSNLTETLKYYHDTFEEREKVMDLFKRIDIG